MYFMYNKNKQNTQTLQYHAHQYFVFSTGSYTEKKVITLNHLPFQIENYIYILKNVFSSHKYLILCFQHCIYVCCTTKEEREGKKEKKSCKAMKWINYIKFSSISKLIEIYSFNLFLHMVS